MQYTLASHSQFHYNSLQNRKGNFDAKTQFQMHLQYTLIIN